MYEFIKGSLASKQPDQAVVEAGGIGYRMKISLQTFESLPGIGEPVTLLTHLHVREDIFELFGFSDAAERAFFHQLIAISKIGPKAALTILSGGTPQELSSWVLLEDAARLAKLQGIGPTTARRIIAELKPRLEKAGETLAELGSISATAKGESGALEDAILALEALGFQRSDAYARIRKVQEALGPDAPTQALIKGALQQG